MAYQYGQIVVTLVPSYAHCPKSDNVAKDEDQNTERVPSLWGNQPLSLVNRSTCLLGIVRPPQTPTQISGTYPSFVSSFTAELGCGGPIAS